MQATVVGKPETALENGLVFSAKYRRAEAYVPMAKADAERNGSKYSSIEVSVIYRLGGMNYFSGSTEPRCYALSVKPVDKTAFGTSRTLLGTGFDNGVCVAVETTRAYSQKKLVELAERVNPERMAQLYIAGDKQAMQEALEALRA